MTFAQLRRRNLLRNTLSTARGAEQVLYLPGGGGERTVVAAVQSARAHLRERTSEEVNVEEIDVRLSNDPEATDNGVAIGGVARPDQRDRLVLSARGDGLDQAFGFAFIIRQSPDSWLCRFERHRTRRMGLKQSRS